MRTLERAKDDAATLFKTSQNKKVTQKKQQQRVWQSKKS